MQPSTLKCLQENSLFCSLGPSKTHLFTFSSGWVNFGIFRQNESADVMLSQFDRQTHHFGDRGAPTDVCKCYLQLFKNILAWGKVKPVNECQLHWHRGRKCATTLLKRKRGKWIDKNFVLDGQKWNCQSSAGWTAASAGRRPRAATESISPLSGWMIFRRHVAIAGCYRRLLSQSSPLAGNLRHNSLSFSPQILHDCRSPVACER